MEQDFWHELGIAPTTDITGIKRAYTTLAHKINPDDDSERYSKLHDAYKAALEYARGSGTDNPVQKAASDLQTECSGGESGFDFTQIITDTIQPSSTEDAIIEDIVFFRESNNLTSINDMRSIPHIAKLNLAIALFRKYAALAQASGDVSVWYTFFDEPIVKYAEKYNLDEIVRNAFPENSVHKNMINEILDERQKNNHRYDTNAVEINRQAVKKAKRDTKSLVINMTIITIVSVLGAILFFAVDISDARLKLFLILFCICSAVICGIVAVIFGCILVKDKSE